MSQISRAGLGVIALSLTLGAVQLASGHDLTGGLAAGLGTGLGTRLGITGPETISDTVQTDDVNRAAKADRAAALAAPSALTRTILIRLDGLADSSVLIRIPLVQKSRNESRNLPPAPVVPAKPGDRKLRIACEPVVSTLTEVAKLLQPGRCVT
jgi:hypothetical protein